MKRISAAGLIFCIILVLAAGFAGYRLSTEYKNRLLEQNGIKSGEGNSGANNSVANNAEGYTALNMTPVNVVFEVNSETGRIENILIEILRCASVRLDYIRIAPEVSYTMTSTLYSTLTVDNTELPQTVTLSELYRYYHNEHAYEAGVKILSEMLNYNIKYYTAIFDTELERVMTIQDSSTGLSMGFCVSSKEARGTAYGSEGSVKGIIEKCLENAATDWEVSDRLRYLDTYDALTEESVTFTNAPVKELNETCELDITGTDAILFGILY